MTLEEKKIDKKANKYAFKVAKYFLTSDWCNAKRYYLSEYQKGNYFIIKKLDKSSKIV